MATGSNKTSISIYVIFVAEKHDWTIRRSLCPSAIYFIRLETDPMRIDS